MYTYTYIHTHTCTHTYTYIQLLLLLFSFILFFFCFIIYIGTIAYSSQTPWIEDGTIRKNIAFNPDTNDLNIERYAHVIHCCALEPDLEIFEKGEWTEIGER